jgi:acyl-CoA hydrolase
VALDYEGRPVEVPGLILETEEDRRRNTEGEARARARKERKGP